MVHGDGLEGTQLDAAVAAVAGAVQHGDMVPGQGGQLVVQRGLVGLHDQDIGGVLVGDQPVGVGVLGVERVLCRGGCYAEVGGGGRWWR